MVQFECVTGPLVKELATAVDGFRIGGHNLDSGNQSLARQLDSEKRTRTNCELVNGSTSSSGNLSARGLSQWASSNDGAPAAIAKGVFEPPLATRHLGCGQGASLESKVDREHRPLATDTVGAGYELELVKDRPKMLLAYQRFDQRPS